jgi:hypothetical protein
VYGGARETCRSFGNGPNTTVSIVFVVAVAQLRQRLPGSGIRQPAERLRDLVRLIGDRVGRTP